MIRVGVTGGIGSGKTTFCKVWEELGARVLYADDFAKELMVTDSVIIQNLKDTFGEITYLENGELNKDHLITEAFKKNRVDELNAIVHPRMRERAKEEGDKATREGYSVFAYEAAVLLNEGRPEHFDDIILLLADKNKRVKRVMERDQTRGELVLDRMQKQPDFEELTHLVDHILINDSDLDSLKAEAEKMFHKLLK